MTDHIRTSRQLTYAGAALAIKAAVAKAHEIGVPQNISIVDKGGNLLAFARMDGARFLAQHSSFSKAQTAASLGMPTGHLYRGPFNQHGRRATHHFEWRPSGSSGSQLRRE
jgi:uncharacterized protein GlcG (DUF336 family)